MCGAFNQSIWSKTNSNQISLLNTQPPQKGIPPRNILKHH